MTEASHNGPSVTAFLAKMILALAWVGAGGYAAAVLLRETSKTEDVLAALFMFFAPVAWCILKAVTVQRSDEMERKVKAEGLSQGLLFANMWAGMYLGGTVLSSLFLGDGEVNVSGLRQQAVVLICVLPAMAFLISEATSFAALRKYAKREA